MLLDGLLRELQLALVVATGGVGAVLYNFYDEFLLHAKLFATYRVRVNNLEWKIKRILFIF